MNPTKHKVKYSTWGPLLTKHNILFFVHNYFNFCQHKAHIKLIPSAGNAFLKLEQITRTHNRTKQNKATTTKNIKKIIIYEIRIMKRLQRTVQVNSRTNTNVFICE